MAPISLFILKIIELALLGPYVPVASIHTDDTVRSCTRTCTVPQTVKQKTQTEKPDGTADAERTYSTQYEYQPTHTSPIGRTIHGSDRALYIHILSPYL